MRILKLIISAGYLVFRGLFVALGLLFGHPGPPRVVFFYYHEVSRAQRPRFGRQLDLIQRSSIPIAADHAGPWAAGSSYAAVTFDDGFECVVQHGLPELETRGIPVTIFVPSGILGEPAPWEGIDSSSHRVMDEATLMTLPPIVTVGSHSSRHYRMTDLDEATARAELVDSKTRLERILGRPVTLFAFPYGAHDERLVGWCRDAGYQRVFSVVPTPLQPDSILVGRVSVSPDESLLEFRLKLKGGYNWLPTASRWKRSWKARLARA